MGGYLPEIAVDWTSWEILCCGSGVNGFVYWIWVTCKLAGVAQWRQNFLSLWDEISAASSDT